MNTVTLPMCREEVEYLHQLLSGLAKGYPGDIPAPHHTLSVKLAVASRRLAEEHKALTQAATPLD